VETIACSAFGKSIMKTQGELEAAISEVISRFDQEYVGRSSLSKSLFVAVARQSHCAVSIGQTD